MMNFGVTSTRLTKAVYPAGHHGMVQTGMAMRNAKRTVRARSRRFVRQYWVELHHIFSINELKP